MKTLKQTLLIVLFLFPSLLQAMEKEIPFTLDDCDRIILHLAETHPKLREILWNVELP